MSLATIPERSGARDVIGWTSVGIVAVGGLAVLCQRVLEVGPQQCSLRVLAGIPCPVCGLSTSALRVGRGDVLSAMGADAFGVAFLVVVAVLAIAQSSQAAGLHRWQPAPLVTGVVAVGLLLGHWLGTLTGFVSLAPLT